ncbi:MAG: hypothetical protein ACI4U3_09885 [Traorella sp.]
MKGFKKILNIFLSIFLALSVIVMKPSIASAENTDWESALFRNVGFSVRTNYFEEGNEVNANAIYSFVNMSSEMQQYLNDTTWYYELTLSQYMEIVDRYFQKYNESDIKDYLTKLNCLDGENVSIYSGGTGTESDWKVTHQYVDSLTGYYHIQGLYLDTYPTTSGAKYDDLYIYNPVELVLSTNNANTYEIVSYTKNDHYIETTKENGLTLNMFDESLGITSTLYGITLHDAMGAYLTLPQDESFIRYYEVDGYLWHDVDTIVNWEAVCNEGYTCKVQVTRLCDGVTSVEYLNQSGSFSGKGQVDLRVIAQPLYTIDADHASVVSFQGLQDMGDGSYAYTPGYDTIELEIVADEGYVVDEVVINHDNGFYYSVGYLNSYGRWEITPDEPVPGVIEIRTHKVETITIESDDSSSIKATVEIDSQDEEQFEGLTFIVDEVDNDSTTFIMNQLDAENVCLLDLHFVNDDGEVVKTDALMKVTIAIPEGWDAEKTEVYYYDSETNEVVNMKGVVSEDGTTITFTTTHFSYYALVQKKDSGSIKTSDTNHIVTWLFVLLLTSICLLVSVIKRLKIEL